MAYVFSDQQNKLSSLLGDSNTSTDDMFPLATRKKEINQGEIQFAKDSLLLKEYATGTIASGELDLPSDWLKNHILVISDYILTNDREISLSDYERYYNFGGSPPYFYYWEFSGTRKMKFFGSVNGETYKFWYFKRPTTELDSDSDTSLFPEEYRQASVYYAAAELMEQIGKTELSNRYRQVYGNYVARAQEEGRQHYVEKEYPRPDFGESDNTTVDVQGRSWPY